MLNKAYFTDLVHKYINGTITDAERDAFFNLLEQHEQDPELEEILRENYQQSGETRYWSHAYRTAFTHRLVQKTIRHRSFILRKTFLRYAVAAMLIFAIGSGVYYFNNQSSAIIGGTGRTGGTREDIAPGGNKAIWTLADGKQVELDSTVLDMTAKKGNEVGYNELRTPRGGQYQLILPDGSKVWLNAASSIKYPVVFEGKERKVEVSGEVYLEIAKKLNAPFSITAGNTTIQVLGTSFNINTYPDEESQMTTLISGSVKIIANDQQVILNPGEIASVNEHIKITAADIDQVIAWKDGLFNFNGAKIDIVMRQLERWYDLQVRYEGKVPDIIFKGEMYRNAPLSDILAFFKRMNIHLKLEGKTLIVSE